MFRLKKTNQVRFLVFVFYNRTKKKLKKFFKTSWKLEKSFFKTQKNSCGEILEVFCRNNNKVNMFENYPRV